MKRLKTKRVLWTIAGLIAIGVIAALLLHKPEQPKIIGKLSKEDVSEISKVALNPERDALKEEARILLHQRKIGYAMLKMKRYIFVRVFSIQLIDSHRVRVAIGTGTNQEPYIELRKVGDRWIYW